jgi:hypothetical protein
MAALRMFPEFEEALRQVPGIRAASVVTGPDAKPTEVHVLAAPGKPAKQVVRDVQSVAMAQFDLDLDHRIVSVVQIGEADLLTGIPTATADSTAPAFTVVPDIGFDDDQAEDLDSESTMARPSLTAISVGTTGGETEVTVNVTIDGTSFTGVASGPGAPIHRPRIVAQATLNSLSELLGINSHIESAQLVDFGSREVAVTVLTLSIPRLGEQVVCGSALVRGDAEDAVARSVLAGVNRRLTG